MTEKDYRAAVDAAEFDPGFQGRTMAHLEALNREKECIRMKRPIRIGLVAACLVAVLAVTASAAVLLLSPKDVAEHINNPALAAAFDGEEAVLVNDTRTVENYDVTLLGLVSGEGLNALDLEHEKTYAVLAFAGADGSPITNADDPPLTVSPVVSGYAPWKVNAWTLNGGVCWFAEEGVLYYLLDCDTLEPFADHTVSLAVYPGAHMPPSAELFAFSDDGTISLQKGQEGALFKLPLDESKADPVRVQAILDELW